MTDMASEALPASDAVATVGAAVELALLVALELVPLLVALELEEPLPEFPSVATATAKGINAVAIAASVNAAVESLPVQQAALASWADEFKSMACAL